MKRRLNFFLVVMVAAIGFSGCTTSDEQNDESKTQKTVNQDIKINNLDIWIDEYTYFEFDDSFGPLHMNKASVYYNITIYKEENNYFANIEINSWMVEEKIKAIVFGDNEKIEIIHFLKENGNINNDLKKGDILFIFKKIDSEIYTEWCAIKPIIYPNENLDNTYGFYFITKKSIDFKSKEERLDALEDNFNDIKIYKEFYNSTLKITKLKDKHIYGVVDFKGNTIIECIYDDIVILSKTRIIAFYKSEDWSKFKAYIYDGNGNVISDGEWRTIDFFYNNEGIYSDAGIAQFYNELGEIYFYLVDQDGNKVVENPFSAIFLDSSRFNVFHVFENFNEEYYIDSKGDRMD